MTDAKNDLRAKRESIEQDIQIAEREGQTRRPEVKLWLKKVEAVELKVAAIKEAYDQRTNCIAMPSLNIVSNYKLGRRAFQKKEEMVELLAAKFDAVAKKLPPGPATELATPSMVSNQNSNFETICQYLKENMTGIIGIWGMGGVGKTTLLKSINNEFYRSRDGMFDHVNFVVVSQQYTDGKIRSDIAKNLGLPSTNEDADANAIKDYLKKKSFLLLLDDLWSELDLEKIGVPQSKLMHHDQDKHKRMVVFTTRSDNVCASMEVNMKIKMECLVPDAAWRLFKEIAGEELIASDNLIQQHAKDIARECAGLTLALVTVGKAMRTKRTAQEWEYVASMMRKSKYPGIPVMTNLESDILRQCFLYCSLWGEDVAIDTNGLIECWMGHGLLDDFDNLNDAYNKGGIFIGNLKEACLLESCYYEHVKLHDVIRDLALWITSDCGRNKQGWFVQPKSISERLPEDVIDREVINISVNNIIEALDGFPNCHKLKTLILSTRADGNFFAERRISTAEFFTKMRCLKYLDLIHSNINILPEEIGGLIGLEYLRLPFSLGSLPMALGDLKNLKYLYIVSLRERKIPYGLIARLTKLRVLYLSQNIKVNLEERHVDELLILKELKGVGINIKPSSSTLERLRHVPKRRLRLGCLPHGDSDFTSISISPSQLGSNSKTNLHKLDLTNIPRLQELVMTTEGDSSWCLSHLNELLLQDLPQLKNVIWKDVETHFFLPGLVLLDIDDCHSLTSLCWTAHLPRLEHLVVTNCDELVSIIKTSDDNTTEVIEEEGNLFKSLKSLVLVDNLNLECIYEGELSLPSIEYISFSYCAKLRKLPLGLDSAKNLKRLWVTSDMWDNMDWAHKDHFSHLYVTHPQWKNQVGGWVAGSRGSAHARENTF
ncbi:P-loop containing nucleoside triphosphate hydrolase protein [Dioscorea alata]|uniref:P-loop containing nucleoside triphosphate hydrolase protein n=1 Tax=Dioscorea alata TaxID=55571 RepID=A0ACB7VK49_DIOAL|nr:P-loop containing nucleoside triphosphate hydrolase protein [Dioscorea alata]